MKKKRAAILISGRGSNMAALIAAASAGDYPAEIAGVISNRADAPGLEQASRMHVATRVVPQADFADRQAHEAAIHSAVTELKADVVCLAGYMRRLTDGFVKNWEGRMINIHPSLLPLFKGTGTHAQALAAGLRIHGATVHFVTHDVDSGPIIAQAAVPVLAGDTAETLAARVLKAEHKLYPLALALVSDGKARMEGGRTVFDGIDDDRAGAPLLSPASWLSARDIEELARFTP